MNLILVSVFIVLARVQGTDAAEPLAAAAAAMRARWRNKLVGSGDLEDTAVAAAAPVRAYARRLSAAAGALLPGAARAARNDTRRLWPREGAQTNSADLTTQFAKLNVLAKAYGTKGTTSYKKRNVLSTIVGALDFMTRPGRYDGEKYFGNWWDWQIGVPQELTSILMIMYEDVPHARLAPALAALAAYVPSPRRQLPVARQDRSYALHFMTGYNSVSNRLRQALSVLALGLLIENSEKIDTAIESAGLAFELVTSGDGFYEDGSFIYHDCIPYAGEYGKHIVRAVGDMFSIVSNYKTIIASETMNRFVETVEAAYVPLIVDGETMSMVNGRTASRAPAAASARGRGSDLMYDLMQLGAAGGGHAGTALLRAAKYWIVRNPDYYYGNARDFQDLQSTRAVMLDATLDTNAKPFLGSRMYGAMDRFVYGGEAFTLGISMHSARTSAIAVGNGENRRGWHAADGMLQLYNGDGQFGAAYWPTVDWRRLPGTTANTAMRPAALGAFPCVCSRTRHAGGAADGAYAAISMQLDESHTVLRDDFKSNLKAKKSWFVFDGTVVCLGTDVSGTTNRSIETVIENRLLNPKSVYEFVDQTGNDARNSTRAVKAYDWFLLKSSGENESIGYVMLAEQKVATRRERRTETYAEINAEFPGDAEYEGTYQTISVIHGEGDGTKVVGGKYAYVTYPNATPEKLDAARGRFTITSNDEQSQAVRDNENDVVGATVWAGDGATVAGVRADGPAALVVGAGALAAAEPTQARAGLRLALPGGRCVRLRTVGALGRTFRVTARAAELAPPRRRAYSTNPR